MIVLGYNKPRPTTEDYARFLEILRDGLTTYAGKDTSFMVYGSITRPDDLIHGVSDIDCCLVTPDDVVTDKQFIKPGRDNIKNIVFNIDD